MTNKRLYEEFLKKIHLDMSHEQTLFVPIIGGGQIIAEDGTLKTELAGYMKDRYANDLGVRVDVLSPDFYLLSYELGLREALPECYDWKKMASDLASLKRGETVTFQDPSGCKIQKRNIGPLDIILFEGIYSCFTQFLRDMSDLVIGVYGSGKDNLGREMIRAGPPYNNGRGYSPEEIIETFLSTQFTVRKDYFSREIRKADWILDESQKRIFMRK